MRLIDADALERKIMMMPDDVLCEDCCYNVVNAIGAMPTIGVWTSVKDRLPGTYEPFYAACKSLIDDRENWVIEGIYKCTSFGGPWGVPLVEMGKAEVYAWMPKKLPEPPKEDKT